MASLVIPLLRIALVALLVGSVMAQAVVVLFASEQARIYPEYAYLAAPYSTVLILAIGCFQVMILAVWRLVSMVSKGTIFTRPALRWIDVITACGSIAMVLVVAPLVHMLFVVHIGGPLILALLAILVGGSAFVLITVVSRRTLAWEIADRSELDEVI